ncbi:polyketide synthase dehydratase domain-containing protein, partial [Dactylosporangium sp. NPDC000555]|uniref:polyketide synthase dehydratase domain-containing protein n=1 Tax=Dactylosporangium sp. NPDC000555 TaxID=3154260 RepID=UPI00331EA06D
NHLPQAPTYPFQHQSYWLTTGHAAGAATHPFLTTVVHRADIDGTLHTGTLSPAVHTWLAEHVIGDTTLLPATAFAEMAIFAGDAVGYGRIEELTLRAPLPLDRTAALQVCVGEPDHQDRRPITVYARPANTGTDEAWTCHATGHLGADIDPPLPDTAPWPPAGAVEVDVDDLYELLAERGYRYGASFRGLTAAWRDGETIFAEVTVGAGADIRGYGVHPALFDAALHCLGVTDDGAGRRLPVQWSGVSLHATGARSLRVRVTPAGDDEVAIAITDPAGAPVLSIDALTLRETAGPETATAGLYTLVWKLVADGGRRGAAPGTVVLDAGAVPADRPGAAVAWVLEQLQQRLEGSEHLVVVTRGAVAVTDTDDPDPDQGAVWGLVRSA